MKITPGIWVELLEFCTREAKQLLRNFRRGEATLPYLLHVSQWGQRFGKGGAGVNAHPPPPKCTPSVSYRGWDALGFPIPSSCSPSSFANFFMPSIILYFLTSKVRGPPPLPSYLGNDDSIVYETLTSPPTAAFCLATDVQRRTNTNGGRGPMSLLSQPRCDNSFVHL